MFSWINANSGAIMAMLTAIYVVGTILIYFSNRTAIKTAIDLHEAVCRPVVVCDFITQHSLMYFRIRNVGMRSAENVGVKVVETPPLNAGKWSEQPIIRNGITFLSPGSEIVCLYSLPGVAQLPEVEFFIEYFDNTKKKYTEQYKINLDAWLKEDLGRENNAPIVRKLDKIADSLAKIAQHGK